MRIVLVVHTFFPNWHAGTEVYTRSLARKAVERGHQVHIVCYEPPEPNEIFDGLRISDTIFEELPVHRISFLKRYGFFHLKESFNREVEDHLGKYFAELQPDVVHVTHAMHLSTASIWAARKLNLPVVSTATDFWYVCPTFQLVKWDDSLCRGPHPLTCLACITAGPSGVWIRRLAKHQWLAHRLSPILTTLASLRISEADWASNLIWLSQRLPWMQQTLARVDVLLAPTPNTAKLLTVNEIRPLEMRASGFGLEMPPVAVQPVPHHHPILRVGFIGTFRHTKGLHVLLEAMRKLPPQSIRLDIYGSPGHFPEYDALVKTLAADLANVAFRGTFPNEQLAQVFAGLDILVMPALWYENSPLVVLSSFACHTPVVASDVGSLADLVKHGENGLLFKMGDPDDLAQKLQTLIDDPPLLDRLRAGIPAVRTIEQNAEEVFGIYSHLIENFKSHPRQSPPRPASRSGLASSVGSFLAKRKFRRFGAQFGDDLTLLHAGIRVRGGTELVLDLQWHCRELSSDWAVFIHFLDDTGQAQIQGDHQLCHYNQDPWGFVTYAFKIGFEEAHAGKSYRVRLGVWNPSDGSRLPVTRARHVTIDAPESAVFLQSVQLQDSVQLKS